MLGPANQRGGDRHGGRPGFSDLNVLSLAAAGIGSERETRVIQDWNQDWRLGVETAE
jgi:hypothetical protein